MFHLINREDEIAGSISIYGESDGILVPVADIVIVT